MADNGRNLEIGKQWITSKDKKPCKICAALDGRKFYYKPRPGQRSIEEMPPNGAHPNCRCTTRPLRDEDGIVTGKYDPTEASSDIEYTGSRAQPKLNPKELEKATRHAILTVKDGVGGSEILAMKWANDDPKGENPTRSIFQGPVYGNFCGGHWCGARSSAGLSTTDTRELLGLTAVDALDAACKKHDRAYIDARQAYEDATVNNKPDGAGLAYESVASNNRLNAELAADRQLVQDIETLPEDPRTDPADKWDRQVGWKNEAQYEYSGRYRKFAKFFFELKLDNMTLDSDDLRGDPREGR